MGDGTGHVTGLAPLDGAPDPDGADCVACGRCCHHEPRTVHLLEADEARMEHAGPRLLPLYTELDATGPGFRFVKNTGERCIGLAHATPGHYACELYEVRPEDCRIVEPGSPCCLEARRLGKLGTSVEFRRVR